MKNKSIYEKAMLSKNILKISLLFYKLIIF